jgi:hypothetical protein
MNDSARNAAVLAWCLWVKEDRSSPSPGNLAEGVRVALDAARPFIEAPLRAEIDRLERELAGERARTTTARDSLLNLLVAEGGALPS